MDNIIDAIGAMAEALRLLREQLEENGFTRAEAMLLVRDYMIHALTGGKENE